MRKISHTREDSRKAILDGIEELAWAVKSTMGPQGRLVLVDRLSMFPIATKDGVTVAKEFESPDKLKNIAIKICKEIAMRTEEEAGDGTTTSIVLAEALVREGMMQLQEGVRYIDFKKGLEQALTKTLEILEEMSTEVTTREDIKNVALVSSNYDEDIAEKITEALERTNRMGTILIEDAKGLESSLDVVQGFSIDKGWISPYFITHQATEEVIYENVKVLAYKNRLEDPQKLVPICNYCLQSGHALLIVCDQISPELLTMLVVNKLQTGLKVCVVHPPYHGDRHWAVFEDLSAVTGASILDSTTLDTMTTDHLGHADKIQVSKRRSVIISNREGLSLHIERIKERLSGEKMDFMRKHLKERLSRLTGGIGILRIGAPTEFELKEQKDRAIDAHLATVSALEEGVIEGGGLGLFKIAGKLNDCVEDGSKLLPGYDALISALDEPLFTIAENSGQNMDRILEKAEEGLGYNANLGKYQDLKKAGVLDPAKVVRCAIQNAVSVAKILLNTEMVIQYEDDDEIRRELSAS